jgi:hypothetical protein
VGHRRAQNPDVGHPADNSPLAPPGLWTSPSYLAGGGGATVMP